MIRCEVCSSSLIKPPSFIFQISSSERPSTNCLILFRSYGMTNDLFNECFANCFIPAFIIFVSTTMIASIYIMVKAHSTVTPEIYGINLGCALLNAVFIIKPTIYAASLHATASAILDDWRKGKDLLCIQDQLKLRSLRPIGIHVAGFYIIKERTPKTYFRYGFDITLNVLLGTS